MGAIGAAAVGLALLCFVRGADAVVSCYDCSTTYMPESQAALNCNDTFKNELMIYCPGLTCVKLINICNATDAQCQQMYQMNSGSVVRRYCLNATINCDNCETVNAPYLIATVCKCNGDKCNGATTTTRINTSAAYVATAWIVATAIFTIYQRRN